MTPGLREPYATAVQERDAARFGMMVFLGSELMLFGAIFGAALVLFLRNPADVAAASAELNLWLGAANTVVLLTSSLFVAIGVEARGRAPRLTATMFLLAAALGLVFLGVKAFEYATDYRDGIMPATAGAHFATGVQYLFMSLYFVATGLHAIHLTIGIALLSGIALRLRSSAPPTDASVENSGLYWHLVDLIWVFLYPVLYLTRT